MLLSWHLISPSLLILWLCSTESLCPESCICKQSEKGQRKVSCSKGGMLNPIPVTDFDLGMEVLQISAPQDNPNILSIGPIFQPFKHLEEITIRRSNIHQIGVHPFWGVPTIRLLDLSHNNISAVYDHNFRGLVNLVELNLDFNRIERLSVGAFKHLTELRILTLTNNFISDLEPRIFLKLVKLHVLKLSENKFEDELIPDVFKDVPDLRVLELRGCNIKRINAQLYHLLPYLSHLDLGNNRIPYLLDDEFHDLHHLHILKLDGNLLPVILERTFINQQQLKYLCLAKNRLAKITDTAFLNLTNLVELDISYNKLRQLENVAFTHVADTLQRLVISGNYFPLSLLKMFLQTLYKVWHLEMAHMKLTILPDHFLPERVKKLNISWNNLTTVSVYTFPKELVELDISFNNIKGLNDSTVIKLETLKYVNFTGNPWSCDLCNITPILFRVNRTKLFEDSVCASPHKLAGQKLLSLRLEDVTTCEVSNDSGNKIPADKLSLLVGLICIIVSAVFSIIFVVYSCMKRHSENLTRQRKRTEREENNIANATAVFCKGEISFKFPLDLTERRMSVSTIDEIKKESQQSLPNGTATGI